MEMEQAQATYRNVMKAASTALKRLAEESAKLDASAHEACAILHAEYVSALERIIVDADGKLEELLQAEANDDIPLKV
jgi:hypothetical protein